MRVWICPFDLCVLGEARKLLEPLLSQKVPFDVARRALRDLAGATQTRAALRTTIAAACTKKTCREDQHALVRLDAAQVRVLKLLGACRKRSGELARGADGHPLCSIGSIPASLEGTRRVRLGAQAPKHFATNSESF